MELEAVHLTGRIEVVTDEEEIARIDDALDQKYAAFRTASTRCRRRPATTTRGYAARAGGGGGRTYLRLVADDRILSWDNRKLGLS